MRHLLLLFSVFISSLAHAATSFELVGQIPSDCTITIGTIPTPEAVGAILRNPGTPAEAIPVPVNINCSTVGAQLGIKATNGGLRSTTLTNPISINYTVAITGTSITSSSTPSGASLVSTEAILGTMTSVGDSTVTLNITPTANPNIAADIYSETFTLTINGQ